MMIRLDQMGGALFGTECQILYWSHYFQSAKWKDRSKAPPMPTAYNLGDSIRIAYSYVFKGVGGKILGWERCGRWV